MKSFLLLLLFLPFLAQAQIVETIVGNGVAGYSGDNGLASSAELNGPISVKFDHSGNMYIVDQNNNAVRKVNLSGIITTIVGNGIDRYSGDGGPDIDAGFSFQAGCTAIDTLGNLYVADYNNNRIRRIVYTPTNTYTAVSNLNNLPEQIILYPNPAHNEINITAPGITQITINSLLGQTLITQNCDTKQLNLNIESLPPGIYAVKVTTVNGTQTISKIIKE